MTPIVKRPPVLPDRVLPLAGCQHRGRLTAGGAEAEVLQRVARPDGREVLRKARRANEGSRRGLRHPLMIKPEQPRKQVPARFRFCVFRGRGSTRKRRVIHRPGIYSLLSSIYSYLFLEKKTQQYQ